MEGSRSDTLPLLHEQALPLATHTEVPFAAMTVFLRTRMFIRLKQGRATDGSRANDGSREVLL